MKIVLIRGDNWPRACAFCKKYYVSQYNELIDKPKMSYVSFDQVLDSVKKMGNPSLNFYEKESKEPGILGIICARPQVGTEREQNEKLEFLIVKAID